MKIFLRLSLLILATKLMSTGVVAQQVDPTDSRYSLVLSPLTVHRNYDPEHAYVWLVGLERELNGREIQGLSFFKNSFGQPSLFLYPWGRVYRPLWGSDTVYLKWGAGLLYGYRGRYEKKVPLNLNGFSPGLIVGLGWEVSPRVQAQLNLLGTAAVMFSFNIRLSESDPINLRMR